ncbi:hypothetical protein CS0771_28110 [Catellatospora sp. IY07-71]|nr:hypothetical protein CS0771_28110 [Catellatospora sp. IY07-71]
MPPHHRHPATRPGLLVLALALFAGGLILIYNATTHPWRYDSPELMLAGAYSGLALAVLFVALHALAWVLREHHRWTRKPD